MVVEATVALAVLGEVKVTPTGMITVLLDTLADIQELETTAHLIPMGTTALGLEAGLPSRQMSSGRPSPLIMMTHPSRICSPVTASDILC